jgi:hypothetical protein
MERRAAAAAPAGGGVANFAEKETGLKINPIYHVYWRGDSDKLRCARTASKEATDYFHSHW